MNELKYELLVQPHADVGRIVLRYRGTTAVKIAEGGDLVASTPLGSFRDTAPYICQEIGGQRVDVPAAYRLGNHGDAYRYGIELGAYAPAHPLAVSARARPLRPN